MRSWVLIRLQRSEGHETQRVHGGLSILNTRRIKSIRARLELWGCCVTTRIRSLSLAEPQHNTTAEPQYVLLGLLPSSSFFSLPIALHLPLSLLPLFCSLTVIQDCQTQSDTSRKTAQQCLYKHGVILKVKLQGSQTAAHFTAKTQLAFVTCNFSFFL